MNDLEKKFFAQFAARPEVLSFAPGRLEILGNHTDYNAGLVLSCAIDRGMTMAVARNNGSICRVKDFRLNAERSFKMDEVGTKARGKNWINYVKGVVAKLKSAGHEVDDSFDLGMLSNMHISAGMSSSAAFEVALIMALDKLYSFRMDKLEMALVGQQVENGYFGLHSGLLDQFSSLFGEKGKFVLCDFRTDRVTGTYTLPSAYSFVVVNSMKKHSLVDSEYNARRCDTESALTKLKRLYPQISALRDVDSAMLENAREELSVIEYRRTKHVVTECERVVAGCAALEKGDVETFGALLWKSHESSRRDFENSSAEQDYLVELSKSIPGCLGARLSGGGFGGITIHLVGSDAAEEYAKRIKSAYKLQMGIDADVLKVELGEGARLLEKV